MVDHDQRFKTLIREFFVEFLALFFHTWAERLDCTRIEWLDKEVFADPPEGGRQVLDLVARLPTRQQVAASRPGEAEQWLALVHIEIESPDKATTLRSRMFYSYANLRQKYGMPVLPIAVFLKVGLEGLGIDVYEEHFWELRPVLFHYLPLDPDQQGEFDRLLLGEPYQGARIRANGPEDEHPERCRHSRELGAHRRDHCGQRRHRTLGRGRRAAGSHASVVLQPTSAGPTPPGPSATEEENRRLREEVERLRREREGS